MPAAAERPRPPQILPIREGPRRQSPPPYNKSPGTRSPPPPSLSSSTPKAVLSPRTKKSLPSPPLEPEVNQFDKLGAKPRSPSPLKPEPELEHKSESRTEPPHLQALERAEEPKQAQDREEKESDIIDREVFEQILELDEDPNDRDFSREMVYEFFDQVDDTFGKMDKALEGEELETLSQLGHFLKGSSAALGLRKVQASCERIQHYGNLRDEEAGSDLKPQEALKRIEVSLGQVKKEYASAEKWLKNFYSHQSS